MAQFRKIGTGWQAIKHANLLFRRNRRAMTGIKTSVSCQYGVESMTSTPPPPKRAIVRVMLGFSPRKAAV